VRAALEALQSDPGRVVEAVPAVSAKKRPDAPLARPRLLTGVAAALVVALVALWLFNPRGAVQGAGCGGAAALRSLAVLPLSNLSGDSQQEYFADGMTDELITSLGKISTLTVIARSSVMEYKGRRPSLREVGRALRVSAVIEGSVLQAQGRVRITARLIQVATGKLLWSESYERNLRDVLALQSEVALAIAKEIQVKLTPQEQAHLAAGGPVEPEAYRAYLKGRSAWVKYTLEGFQESEGLFRRAIDIAPTYAPAWAGLADAAYGMSSMHLPPNVAIPRARAAAEKALALDESLAEAHTSFGTIKMVYDWDWTGAEREFDRAIALRPGDANAHLWRGHLLVCQGRFDEGLAAIGRALELDPLSSWISANLGWHLYYARRYDQALKHLQRAAQTDPEYYIFQVFLGLVRQQQGDHAAALAALERAVELDTNNDNLAQLAHAYGTAGRRQDAERTIVRLLERRERGFVPAANIAMAYSGLGDKDEAFRWLESAVEDHSEWLIFLKVDPALDPIRSDPRFAALLRRLSFER
jgi:eukaryotic-like serine/threonine-protein kinase